MKFAKLDYQGLLIRLIRMRPHLPTGRFLPIAALTALLLIPTACAPRHEGFKHSPYTIRGVRYTPMHPQLAVGFQQRGIASHYDERGFFRRGKTAIGEPFRASALAGAHKTVPLPARIRVTNLQNGRSTVVRVNDRGPFIPGRVIDLTPRAARTLGFYEQGLTDVHIEVLSVGDGRYRIR